MDAGLVAGAIYNKRNGDAGNFWKVLGVDFFVSGAEVV